MTKPFSCGIIGCGSVSVMHCQGILQAGEHLDAFCDIKPEKADAHRQKYAPHAKVFSDWRDFLANSGCDAIHICTPHYLHAEMAIEALKMGKHVFLEKPMCTTPEDLDKLIAVSEVSQGQIAVCFQNRFLACNQVLYRMVKEFGGPTHARGVVTWKREAPYYTESGWRGKWETECGGVMINQAIHTLDLLLGLFGEMPETIDATTANHHLRGVIEVEDTCEARMVFSGARTALFYATTAYGEDAPNLLEVKCGEHRILLYGDQLFCDGKLVPTQEEEVTSLGKKCWGNGHFRLIGMFYDSIREGKPTPVSPASASLAVRVLLECYQSSNK